jgi:hypothetical protein
MDWKKIQTESNFRDPILWYEKRNVAEIRLEDVVGTPDELSYELDIAFEDCNFIILHLSALEVELLLWRFLGYTSAEISQMMNFKNIYYYYRLNAKLKNNIRQLINLR